jgi:uncharacterized membrane protein (UPF0136 family)
MDSPVVSFQRWLLAVAVGLAVLLAYCPRIFYGIDIGDAGNQLAKQQSLVEFREIRGAGATTLLSDFVGGVWCRFGPGAKLLWMRFGGALLGALSAIVAFSVLAQIFPVRRAAIVTASSGGLLAAVETYETLVNYYSVPAFLLTCSLALLFSSLRRSVQDREPFIRPLLCGLLLGAAIMARLPLLVLIPVMLLLPILHSFGSPSHRRQALTLCAWLACGVMASFAATGAILILSHLFRPYFDSLLFTFGADPRNDLAEYTLASLLPKYLMRGAKSIGISIILCALIALVAAMRQRFNNTVRCAAVVMIIMGVFLAKTNGSTQAVMRMREVLSGIVVCVAFIEIVRTRRFGNNALLLIAGLAVGAALSFGSTLGLQCSSYGLWLGLPAAMLLGSEQAKTVIVRRSLCIGLVLGTLTLAATVTILDARADWVHVDTRFPLWLSSKPCSHPRLRGIFEDGPRIQSIEGAAAAVQEAARRKGTILCFNHAALFYWLTQTRSWFESPVLYHSSPTVCPAQLQALLQAATLPEVVLIRNLNADEFRRDSLVIRQRLLGPYAYIHVLSTGPFEVFRLPIPGAGRIVK